MYPPKISHNRRLASPETGLRSRNFSGFTLVELIVTITILAILGTIGLVSIQNFYGSSRDGVRITDLKSIQQGLTVFQIKAGTYPIPETPIEIKADDITVLSYQGYISDTISSLIKINKNPLDPKDTTRYTYTVSKDYKKAQLMGYLESGDTLKITSYTDMTKYFANHIFNPINTLTHIISQSYAANASTIDYIDRVVYVTGDKIGVLTDENNAPIQESTTATGINLSTEDTTGYTAYFGGDTYGDGTSTGTGDVLITQILGAQTGTIPCNPTTYSGYTITALSHDETDTFIKTLTVANGYGTGSLQVQCLNGVLDIEHAIETINIACDNTFVNTGDNTCVLDECGGSVPVNAEMLVGTTQSISQNWIQSTTAGVCTFDCKTNYTWNSGTSICDANTQQALSCNGSIKPYSTDNSTTTTWTQTWDGTQWLPVYTYIQNITPNICTFACNTGYTWDSVNEVCAANIYIITFNSNGGTVVSNINANYNTTITAPTSPTKTGYTFAGWYKDAGLTTAWNFTTDTVTVATTLYAKWIINYTVTFNANGGGTPSPATKSVVYNTAVGTLATVARTGYTFNGWFTATTGGTQITTATVVTAAVTWYAQWTITYTTGNDSYINRTTNTTAKVGITNIIWDATKHWWKRTSDNAVLVPNKTANGQFNTTTIEGTVQTIAYTANAAAESTYNKDQTNNLFVSPAVVSASNYCRLLNTSYAGNCSDATTLTIYGGFQGTDSTLSSYHAGYTAHGNLSYAGTAVYAGSEQFTPTATSKTSTPNVQYISRQSYNSNTSYCETTYGTGWRLPTDYETGHRNDTAGTTVGNGWNPAYAGSAAEYFWTSSRYSTYAHNRWLLNLSSAYWINGYVGYTDYRVRCVFFTR